MNTPYQELALSVMRYLDASGKYADNAEELCLAMQAKAKQGLEVNCLHVPEVSLVEFRKLWRRSLNTLDPQTTPEWAIDIADKADRNESFILNVKATNEILDATSATVLL